MIYVKDIMSRNVKTIDAGSTIAQSAKAMARWRVGALIVVNGPAPVGIITEGDISRSVAKGIDAGTSLKDFAKRKLVTVTPGELLEVAAKTMAEVGVKKLPVMEDGKLVGIVTQTDIVNSSFALVTSLKEMVKARYRPPDFEM